LKLFGFSLTRTKATPPPGTSFSTPTSRSGGWFRILEPFTGAWQRNIEATPESVLTFHAVYACVTRIANDIAKLRIKLVQEDEQGVWTETKNPAYSPVLRDTNHFQNHIQFVTYWMLSKLIHGNTYVLKERDNRGVVSSLYILDPTRVQVMVAPNSVDGVLPAGVAGVARPDQLVGVLPERLCAWRHPVVSRPVVAGAG
jgi:hypothetical protein